ncbi:hypothetical protein P8452_47366 [Trifolium repens]|nr:hypothetical protein P8452_47366 [Trifolium repens]
MSFFILLGPTTRQTCEEIKDEKNAGKAYVYEMRGKVLNECVEYSVLIRLALDVASLNALISFDPHVVLLMGKFLALIQGGVAFLSSSSSIEKWMARE